ncbi:Acireductone synthase [Aphelenchoides fujianensis]|nr:Acireductone synthase [Aphelenchoides fujianensis]
MSKKDFDACLLDIEGTTSSISFVKDVLFPYCRDHALEFFRANHSTPSVRSLLDELIRESNEQHATNAAIRRVDRPEDFETLDANVKEWIRADLKLRPLKELQGQMWTQGYRNGDFRAHVYDDTPVFFRRLETAKKLLFIYSSGSVLAQKLLFKHTIKGDLTRFICDYFDTHFGAKSDAQSYRKIAAHAQLRPPRILFVTDIAAEAGSRRVPPAFKCC